MFRKKIKRIRKGVIDFTDEAKKYCTFDNHNLRIRIIDRNGNLENEMEFNSYNFKKLKEMEIPILHKMDTGKCFKMPRRRMFLARVRMR